MIFSITGGGLALDPGHRRQSRSVAGAFGHLVTLHVKRRRAATCRSRSFTKERKLFVAGATTSVLPIYLHQHADLVARRGLESGSRLPVASRASLLRADAAPFLRKIDLRSGRDPFRSAKGLLCICSHADACLGAELHDELSERCYRWARGGVLMEING